MNARHSISSTSSMTTFSILVRVCVLGVYKLDALERSCTPLRFCLHTATKLLCIDMCLFNAIVELHAMHEKMLNIVISLESEWISYVIKVHSLQYLYLVFCSGGICHIKLKNLVLIHESNF